jgi:putative tryptophan/tyrosine transport system substrate-binding protein
MRRREFIKATAGSVAVWPLAARAEQAAMPVVGFLNTVPSQLYMIRLNAFRRGLNELGYLEGQNVEIDYKSADGQNDQLPVLAAQLAQRPVRVIVAGGGTPSALAAKTATRTIPIVFETATDPVAIGLVASLDRPGGNITGVTNLNVEIGPKRLELLREVLPPLTTAGILVNATNPALSNAFQKGMETAGDRLGIKLRIVKASTESDLDAVFAALAQQQIGGLVIGPDVFFNAHAEQLATLATRYKIPAVFGFRPFVAAGGLLSYGGDENETYRLVGQYAGRILKGENPADLPVIQSTKVELLINLKTAKALGIEVPLPLLGRADEIIE